MGHYSESEHGVWNKSAPSRHSGFWPNDYDLKRPCTEDKYGQDGRADKESQITAHYLLYATLGAG